MCRWCNGYQLRMKNRRDMFKFQLCLVTSTFAQITLVKVRIQIHMKKELRDYYEEEGDRYELTLDLKRPSL